jgi:predicted permease
MPEWKDEIRRHLAGLRLAPAREAEIVDEWAQHLEESYEELRSEGATDDEARRAVLVTLSVPNLTAGRRDPVPPGAIRSGNIGADLWQDLRYAVRTLRKSPAFAAFVILTLALGIGANTTVFTVINTVLLHPLPVKSASQLVAVDTLAANAASRSGRLLPVSYLNLEDLREKNQVFLNLAGYTPPMPMTLTLSTTASAGSERIFAELVTANYFETLGLRPIMGRFFIPEEDHTPGAHAVVVIGYGTWRQRFGGASDVIGRTMRINGLVFTIAGVAPDGFKGVNAIFGPDIWIPAMMAEQILPAQLRGALRERGEVVFHGAARLKPGVSMGLAEANLKIIAAGLEKEYPDANRGHTVALRPLSEAALGDTRQGALFGGAVLMAIVGLVLLIACSNVANLLLAKAAGRRQEIAVRLALGAGRGRLIRQLLTESTMLGVLSGVVGLALADVGCRLLWSARPAEVAQNFVDLKMDAHVFVFALAVWLVTGLLFGLVPALQSSRADVVGALKEETRTAGRSRRRITFANTLLVGQVALSLVSLITAALFLRSIQRAYMIDPGFQTDRLAVFLVNPGQAGYSRARTEQFYRDVRAQVSAMPGIASVSWSSNLPLWARLSRGILIEGQTPQRQSDTVAAVVNTVDLNYFETTGIALTHGRDFTEMDRDGSLPAAIVNETMAARYWPNQDPLGKRFQFAGDKFFRQIVGVAKTANYQSLNEEPQPAVYVPLRQNFSDTMILHVRTERDPAGVLAAVQREVRAIDSHLDVTDVRTGRKIIDQALFSEKMGVGLLGVFGLLALGLASVGLYGILAYSVNRRRHEIGVRMSLGADQLSVLWLVLRQGMTLVATGIGVGLGASLLIAGALSKLLYGVSATDPVSLAGASLTLLIVAALACYLPARSASRVDPLVALREG